MLTSIPYIKEVIVASFRCEHCGATNNEVQSVGAVRRASIALVIRNIPNILSDT